MTVFKCLALKESVFSAPACKKRKHSDHHQVIGHMPQQLNAAALLNQQYKGMMQQPVIKQEPVQMGMIIFFV